MLSNATVYKILYLKDLSKYKFKKETIERVKWLKSIDNHLESEFKKEEFSTMIDTVLNTMSKRESKKHSQIIELAKFCKTFGSNKYGMTKNFYYSAYDILIDSDFYALCTLGIENCRNMKIRMLAMELRDMSQYFRKRLNIK